MKKLDKSRSKVYGPIVVWADDLFDLFSELKDFSDFELVADDIKFDSIEEFIQESRGNKPSELKIKVRDPYLTIELDSHSARLYVASSQLLASGLFLKIDSILSKCERRPRFIFSSAWSFGGALIAPNIFYLEPFKQYSSLQVFAFAFAFSWMLLVGYIRLRHFSTVVPLRKDARPGFIKRNADGIVIATISALLGAVGGAVAAKIADRIWSPSSKVEIERQSPDPGSNASSSGR